LCMRIEPYDSKYFENCITILQSNTPNLFLWVKDF